jgi:hypothetical protein
MQRRHNAVIPLLLDVIGQVMAFIFTATKKAALPKANIVAVNVNYIEKIALSHTYCFTR